MKTKLLTSALAAILACTSYAREWTSADGSKTFEADFVSSSDGKVTVLRNGKKRTFKLDILSEDDQKWVAENASTKSDEGTDPPTAAMSLDEFNGSSFGKALKKLKKLNGKHYSSHKLESVPKKFILYYSASW